MQHGQLGLSGGRMWKPSWLRDMGCCWHPLGSEGGGGPEIAPGMVPRRSPAAAGPSLGLVWMGCCDPGWPNDPDPNGPSWSASPCSWERRISQSCCYRVTCKLPTWESHGTRDLQMGCLPLKQPRFSVQWRDCLLLASPPVCHLWKELGQ